VDELTWKQAWQLRELVARGEVSAAEVVDHFLARIEALDPVLHAFAHVDVLGARAAAASADRALRSGEPPGPLHGIPVSVKEHIAVAGLPVRRFTKSGDRIAAHDDIGIERLRAAGAIILGTNTMMGTSSTTIGQYNWNREARNPWDTSRVPGWSSSGGAAAAAARLVPVAIGSDGGGSTRLPASYSGIVGMHPTRGSVPHADYANPAHMLTTTIGPLARDVRDAAIAAQVMAGPDGRDFISIQSEPGDYLAELDAGVGGMRLAWTDDFGYAGMYALAESPRVIAHVRSEARDFEALGATVEPTGEVWEDFWPSYMVTSQTFAELVTFDNMPRPSAGALEAALAVRQRNWQRFRALLSDYDLLLSPTSQLTARTIGDWNAAWTEPEPTWPHGMFAPHYTSHTHMFNWLGWPAVSVPCGLVDDLPVGLQIIGKPGSEARILQAAAAFERQRPAMPAPAAVTAAAATG
jgi:aspartyl-tRNA(Asn)/glutamyl-tRNA(Gln) amidotransferase subunit A